MANTKLIKRCIFFLLALSFVLSDGFVGGRSVGATESKEFVKHKGTIKTIEGKDGDVIDCVDIHQQPAFDHPLLKNHIIQMESGPIPNIKHGELYNAELFQSWQENGECPNGTIPIRRSRKEEYYEPHRSTLSVASEYDQPTAYEFAEGISESGHYYGARAFLNVWSPALNDGAFSASQLWIYSGSEIEHNRIEAGWQVFSPSKEPKLYVSWTRDGHNSTGCPNLDCPGFVQTSNKIALGYAIKPSSTYMGKQFEIAITIYKSYGDWAGWYIKVNNEVIGYWPRSLFTPRLTVSAENFLAGGMILNSGGPNGRHSSIHMGSGHFPSEGHGKASYIRNIQYMDGNGKFKDANMRPFATKPSCYDVALKHSKDGVWGSHLYYGGPGYSDKCIK